MSHADLVEKEFEELFKVNYSKLFYCAYDFVRDTEAAKDIVSDVFDTAWSNYSRLRGEKVEAYLYRSVRNRCIDYLRHEVVVREHQQVFLEMRLEYEEEEDNEKLEADIARMRRILATLSPQTRLIFEQCYFEGKKYAEVAEAMSLSEAAVNKHMVKAFSTLRSGFQVKKQKKDN